MAIAKTNLNIFYRCKSCMEQRKLPLNIEANKNLNVNYGSLSLEKGVTEGEKKTSW